MYNINITDAFHISGILYWKVTIAFVDVLSLSSNVNNIAVWQSLKLSRA